MAGVLWDSYKNRMGNSTGIQMGFDLHRLLPRVEGLEVLSRPFDKTEIDLVIKHMPSDKAPGLDGFNGLFLKRCWSIISSDFYKLAMEFHKGGISLESINTSFITLIPKVGVAEGVNDYRPISLTNVCLKFLTKLVANRLQDHILRCVHRNQYGFLRTRTIQDCLAWSFEFLFHVRPKRNRS